MRDETLRPEVENVSEAYGYWWVGCEEEVLEDCIRKKNLLYSTYSILFLT